MHSNVCPTKAYCKWAGIKYKSSPSRSTFRFGVDAHKSLGTLDIQILTRETSFLLVQTDVVPVDVPLFVGLDVLDKFGLTVDPSQTN
jgi:hypothetical protein